jgi:drug/metabolite transporter (DMT)-like permease
VSGPEFFYRLPASLRGGLWLMSAAMAFTIMTVLIRHIAAEIHPFEIAFFRASVNLLLMLPFVIRGGMAVLKVDGHGLYLVRAFIGLIFLMSYFSGAAMIPVANSQSLFFTSPLFAAIMAVILLGETMRARRIIALIIGFAGAMIILRPGYMEFSIGAGLVLVGALANATSNIIVKTKTRTDHPDTIVFYLALYVTPMILIPALFVWQWPNAEQLLWLIGVGIFATLNQRFLSRAFAAADATAVLPFDFARLPFAALIGFLVFGEIPDIWVWTGAIVIFGASVYMAHREAVAARTGGEP